MSALPRVRYWAKVPVWMLSDRRLSPAAARTWVAVWHLNRVRRYASLKAVAFWSGKLNEGRASQYLRALARMDLVRWDERLGWVVDYPRNPEPFVRVPLLIQRSRHLTAADWRVYCARRVLRQTGRPVLPRKLAHVLGWNWHRSEWYASRCLRRLRDRAIEMRRSRAAYRARLASGWTPRPRPWRARQQRYWERRIDFERRQAVRHARLLRENPHRFIYSPPCYLRKATVVSVMSARNKNSSEESKSRAEAGAVQENLVPGPLFSAARPLPPRWASGTGCWTGGEVQREAPPSSAYAPGSNPLETASDSEGEYWERFRPVPRGPVAPAPKPDAVSEASRGGYPAEGHYEELVRLSEQQWEQLVERVLGYVPVFSRESLRRYLLGMKGDRRLLLRPEIARAMLTLLGRQLMDRMSGIAKELEHEEIAEGEGEYQ